MIIFFKVACGIGDSIYIISREEFRLSAKKSKNLSFFYHFPFNSNDIERRAVIPLSCNQTVVPVGLATVGF